MMCQRVQTFFWFKIMAIVLIKPHSKIYSVLFRIKKTIHFVQTIVYIHILNCKKFEILSLLKCSSSSLLLISIPITPC